VATEMAFMLVQLHKALELVDVVRRAEYSLEWSRIARETQVGDSANSTTASHAHDACVQLRACPRFP